jgi:hypothetical protein
MPKVNRFKELDVWQNARKLAVLVYRLTQNERFSKDFGLKDQIRRASVSVVSNIAEGFESQTQVRLLITLAGRKHLLARYAPNFIWRWIWNI